MTDGIFKDLLLSVPQHNGLDSGKSEFCRSCQAKFSQEVGSRIDSTDTFLISNFCRVLNIICILLGISPASDCDLPTFRNPLSVPPSKVGCRVLYIQPLKMELTEGSETSANHNLTSGKYPEEYIQH
jgi:hypothetical protein